MSCWPGPVELGRGVVVLSGSTVPAPWAGCERVQVATADPGQCSGVIAALGAAFSARTPVVVELGVTPGELRAAEVVETEPYDLDATFELRRERLHFLVWANNYDARSGTPLWWHARKAVRRFGATSVSEGADADLVVGDGDGRRLFVDGGPPSPPALACGSGVVHRWAVEAGSLEATGHGPPVAPLAKDQLEAVGHEQGSARVVAPAGSGKTRVLTERLRHLLGERHAPPGAVTVVAFNAKAAEELRGRAANVIGRDGPHVQTLNSLGLWICERGGAGRLRVIEEIDARRLVQEVFEIRRQSNTDTVAPYLDALSKVRLELVGPVEAEAAVPDAVGLAKGFEAYRSALLERGEIDFDDQIYRAIEIVLRDPAIRQMGQARCRYLLVDEFQDLTEAHLLLLRLLSAPGYDCFGVGDDDQVIYGYAGASPSYLLDYGRYFPHAASHVLKTNYRSPPRVVQAVNHLLAYNTRRVDKAILAGRADDDDARSSDGLVVERAGAEELAGRCVDRVASWLAEGVQPDDIAVLARVNAGLLPVQVALGAAGIARTAPIGVGVLQRTGIRSALAYLRIGLAPDRIARRDVLETIRRPSRHVAPKVVEWVTRPAWTSVSEIGRIAGRLTGRDAEKLRSYAEDLRLVTTACRSSSADALSSIRVGIGLGETMDVLDASRRADRSSHTDDLVALHSVALLHPDVSSFEGWLVDALEAGPDRAPAVLLSSVHRIKGREWGHVVVLDASQGSFPHRSSDDEEGERRVFHVALTRARTEVVVLGNRDAPSIFLDELDGTRKVPVPRRRPETLPPGPARTAGASSAGAGRRRDRGETDVDEEAAEGSPEALLEEALRTWRRKVASRDGVPAYVVLNDRELVALSRRAPRSLTELRACKGMGPIRLERFGDEILAEIDAVSPPE